MFSSERNKIRLVNELYQIKTEEWSYLPTGSGIPSRINPSVVLNKNNTVRFNLSDESLYSTLLVRIIHFEMEIFKDSNYQKEFVKTEGSEFFNVTKTWSNWNQCDLSWKLTV